MGNLSLVCMLLVLFMLLYEQSGVFVLVCVKGARAFISMTDTVEAIGSVQN